jgi:hypothetical protein
VALPVDYVGKFRLAAYARYDNNAKRAAAAYTSMLVLCRENPPVYGGREIFCWLYLAEIEARLNQDSEKALKWLEYVVKSKSPGNPLGAHGDADTDRLWLLFQNYAKHETALLQHKQPDWEGALDEAEAVYMMPYEILMNSGLARTGEIVRSERQSDAATPDPLVQLAIRSDISRLDRAMARLMIGVQAMETQDKAALEKALPYLKDLMESDSFFGPQGGMLLAMCQAKAGRNDEAKKTFKMLKDRFPTLKKKIEMAENDRRTAQ